MLLRKTKHTVIGFSLGRKRGRRHMSLDNLIGLFSRAMTGSTKKRHYLFQMSNFRRSEGSYVYSSLFILVDLNVI